MVTTITVAGGQYAVYLSGRLLADVALACRDEHTRVYHESALSNLRLLREQLDEIEAALGAEPAERAA